jgi:hypothetical protein
MIVPIAIVVAAYFGRYTPQQITELQEVPLFLQGSTDMGGSDLFAATVALYVVFGVLGAVRLTIRLADLPDSAGLLERLVFSVRVLALHAILFVVGGTSLFGYDTRITPNDFRNMFLLALLLYTLSVLWVVVLSRTSWNRWLKLSAGLLFVTAWLIVGSDGNTAKAGQVLQAGQDPAPLVRSGRHALMLSWHRTCDELLGDW